MLNDERLKGHTTLLARMRGIELKAIIEGYERDLDLKKLARRESEVLQESYSWRQTKDGA